MCMKNKNIEAQAKFPGSYKKKSVHCRLADIRILVLKRNLLPNNSILITYLCDIRIINYSVLVKNIIRNEKPHNCHLYV